ncbi:hypothetical protein Tco_1235748 [Tanacetum coccineum]
MVEEVTSLKKNFKQKENKYLKEFLDMKALKDKVEDILFKQDQSLQIVHMLCKPKPHYDEQRKVAIGYKNLLYLTRAKQVQHALYNGHEIIKTLHVPVMVHNSEDTLEIAEITRKKMNDKMKTPLWTEQNINIRPPNYSKESYLATFTPQIQLTPEQIFWSKDVLKIKSKALKEQTKALTPITALTVYPPNTPAKFVPKVLPTKSQVQVNIYSLVQLFLEFVKTCKKRITPMGLTEGERGFEQTKACYLTEEMKEVFDQMEAEVDQNVVDKKRDEIERKNLLNENKNLITKCLSKEVFYTATESVLTVSRFSNMHDAFTTAHKRIAKLEAENSNLTHKIQNDDHDETIKHFSKLEVEHLNLQLKYQHLKEHFGNKKSMTSSDAPPFESGFVIRNLKEQLQGRGNTIKELKEKISLLQKKHNLNERLREENKKVKQHYKELYDSIKLTRTKTIEKTTSLLTEIETLKAQIKEKTKCVTMPDPVKPKVLAPETLRKIVEEARAEKPLDSSLASACLYTKHSQELLEYVIGTCPKDFNKRDRKIATAPLIRKKRVTFVEPCETLTHNTQTHVEQQKMKKTNEPGIPSTRLKGATVASGSKPRSNIKKDRTLPAKSDPKTVENHPRNNKSSVKRKNRVDSSISSKRTVINSTSNSVCKTCNKCLISFNHDKCVVKSLKFVKKPPVNKVWRVKQVKQVWQATGKLFTNVGYQWKPTGRKFTLGEQCPLTRFTKSKVVPVKQPENVSTSNIVITKRFSNTSQKPLTRYQRKNKQEKAISTVTPITAVPQSINDSVKPTVCANQQDPNRNWGSNVPNSPYSSVFKCRRYTSSLLNEDCKKALNLLKKGLLVRGSYKDEDGVIVFQPRQWPSIKVKELQEQIIQVFKIKKVTAVGESVAAPEICCRRQKHRCGAQKAAATAAEHLVLPEFFLLLYIVFVDPSCDHIIDTFSAHPPS